MGDNWMIEVAMKLARDIPVVAVVLLNTGISIYMLVRMVHLEFRIETRIAKLEGIVEAMMKGRNDGQQGT